eukprot:g1297.t1
MASAYDRLLQQATIHHSTVRYLPDVDVPDGSPEKVTEDQGEEEVAALAANTLNAIIALVIAIAPGQEQVVGRTLLGLVMFGLNAAALLYVLVTMDVTALSQAAVRAYRRHLDQRVISALFHFVKKGRLDLLRHWNTMVPVGAHSVTQDRPEELPIEDIVEANARHRHISVLDAFTPLGSTMIHAAVSYNHSDIVQYLVRKDAMANSSRLISTMDHRKSTALDIALMGQCRAWESERALEHAIAGHPARHKDARFRSRNWGKMLELFENIQLGFIFAQKPAFDAYTNRMLTNQGADLLPLRTVTASAAHLTDMNLSSRVSRALHAFRIDNWSIDVGQTILDLSGMDIGFALEDGLLLAGILCSNSSLTHINVSGNALHKPNNDSTPDIGRGKSVNTALKEIQSAAVQGQEAIIALCASLRGHPSLSSLKMSNAGLSEDGCCALASLLRSRSCGITALDVSSNDMRPRAVATIGNALCQGVAVPLAALTASTTKRQSTSVVDVPLAFVDFSANLLVSRDAMLNSAKRAGSRGRKERDPTAYMSGCLALAKFMASSTALRTVVARGTRIGGHSDKRVISRVANAIDAHGASSMAALGSVAPLRRMSEHFEPSERVSTGMTALDMSASDLSASDAASLAHGLCAASKLRTLNLEHNRLGMGSQDGIVALAEALGDVRCGVTALNLSDTVLCGTVYTGNILHAGRVGEAGEAATQCAGVFDLRGISALCNALASRAERAMDSELCAARLGSAARDRHSGGLPRVIAPEVVNLSNNRIKAQGARMVARMVKRCGGRLRELRLRHTAICIAHHSPDDDGASKQRARRRWAAVRQRVKMASVFGAFAGGAPQAAALPVLAQQSQVLHRMEGDINDDNPRKVGFFFETFDLAGLEAVLSAVTERHRVRRQHAARLLKLRRERRRAMQGKRAAAATAAAAAAASGGAKRRVSVVGTGSAATAMAAAAASAAASVAMEAVNEQAEAQMEVELDAESDAAAAEAEASQAPGINLDPEVLREERYRLLEQAMSATHSRTGEGLDANAAAKPSILSSRKKFDDGLTVDKHGEYGAGYGLVLDLTANLLGAAGAEKIASTLLMHEGDDDEEDGEDGANGGSRDAGAGRPPSLRAIDVRRCGMGRDGGDVLLQALLKRPARLRATVQTWGSALPPVVVGGGGGGTLVAATRAAQADKPVAGVLQRPTLQAALLVPGSRDSAAEQRASQNAQPSAGGGGILSTQRAVVELACAVPVSALCAGALRELVLHNVQLGVAEATMLAGLIGRGKSGAADAEEQAGLTAVREPGSATAHGELGAELGALGVAARAHAAAPRMRLRRLILSCNEVCGVCVTVPVVASGAGSVLQGSTTDASVHALAVDEEEASGALSKEEIALRRGSTGASFLASDEAKAATQASLRRREREPWLDSPTLPGYTMSGVRLLAMAVAHAPSLVEVDLRCNGLGTGGAALFFNGVGTSSTGGSSAGAGAGDEDRRPRPRNLARAAVVATSRGARLRTLFHLESAASAIRARAKATEAARRRARGRHAEVTAPAARAASGPTVLNGIPVGALRRNELVVLDLSWSGLEEAEGIILASALAHFGCRRLRDLDYRSNALGVAAGRALSRAVLPLLKDQGEDDEGGSNSDGDGEGEGEGEGTHGRRFSGGIAAYFRKHESVVARAERERAQEKARLQLEKREIPWRTVCGIPIGTIREHPHKVRTLDLHGTHGRRLRPEGAVLLARAFDRFPGLVHRVQSINLADNALCGGELIVMTVARGPGAYANQAKQAKKEKGVAGGAVAGGGWPSRKTEGCEPQGVLALMDVLKPPLKLRKVDDALRRKNEELGIVYTTKVEARPKSNLRALNLRRNHIDARTRARLEMRLGKVVQLLEPK